MAFLGEQRGHELWRANSVPRACQFLTSVSACVPVPRRRRLRLGWILANGGGDLVRRPPSVAWLALVWILRCLLGYFSGGLREVERDESEKDFESDVDAGGVRRGSVADGLWRWFGQRRERDHGLGRRVTWDRRRIA